ncbi:hypothetical protein EVAR_99315_1 [Eumeta japonica]|uniref:Uncharacterized protein n=1 Tax=Eumeta variegata TaxID=151549 RepID=A0A4C1YXZ3_EUMVA|nr:hypothetical protein EVAR_99315_1 [Eumeta japonica]
MEVVSTYIKVGLKIEREDAIRIKNPTCRAAPESESERDDTPDQEADRKDRPLMQYSKDVDTPQKDAVS